MLEIIFSQILKMSLTAGVCIVVVSMLHLVFHRIPRKYLYALWIVVAFRLVCPVSVSTPVGLVLMGNVGQIEQTSVTDELVQSEQAVGDGQWSTDDVRKAVDSHVAGTMQGESVVGDGDSVTTAQNNMTDKTAMQDNTTGTAQSTASNVSTDNTANDQSMLPLFSRIWLTGMLLSLIYLLYSYLKTRRRLSHAVLAEDTTSERLIHTGWRLAPVYECDELPSPFAMGIFHPVIYIPFGLEACRREMILLHEQYHIRRRDHLVKLFASVLLAVYWFHPLVWLSWVILCRDMEMSCDEKVLELLGSEQRKAYSLTFTSVCVRRIGRICAAWFRRTERKESDQTCAEIQKSSSGNRCCWCGHSYCNYPFTGKQPSAEYQRFCQYRYCEQYTGKCRRDTVRQFERF